MGRPLPVMSYFENCSQLIWFNFQKQAREKPFFILENTLLEFEKIHACLEEVLKVMGGQSFSHFLLEADVSSKDLKFMFFYLEKWNQMWIKKIRGVKHNWMHNWPGSHVLHFIPKTQTKIRYFVSFTKKLSWFCFAHFCVCQYFKVIM